MLRKKKGEVEWLEFELLQEFPDLVHGVFLRPGGVSEGPFHALNMGGGTNDDPQKIMENRKKAQEALSLKEVVAGKQVHGSFVKLALEFTSPEEECDGIITQEKGKALMIKHADCQAAIFYDPVTHSIANVHSGWRGNVQNIYQNTVRALKEKCGARAENLHVCISPSLGPHNAQFLNYRTEFPSSFWEFQIQPFYFDFWEISRQQLQEAGVLAHHIEVAEICTYSNKADYFSYRRDKVTGRNATYVALR